MSTPTQATLHRWSDLPSDAPMPLLQRSRIIGERMMISRVFLKRGCDVPMHKHENEQFACIMSGSLRFTLNSTGGPDRREQVVSAGEVLHLPGNVPHAAYAIEDTLVLDLFSPPSAGTGIDIPRPS